MFTKNWGNYMLMLVHLCDVSLPDKEMHSFYYDM